MNVAHGFSLTPIVSIILEVLNLWQNIDSFLLRNLTLLKTASFLFAYRQDSFICFAHSKCLWVLLMLSIYWPLEISGCELFKQLLENSMSLDLPALKVTFNLFPQTRILSRSLFSWEDVSAGSVPFQQKSIFHSQYPRLYHLNRQPVSLIFCYGQCSDSLTYHGWQFHIL